MNKPSNANDHFTKYVNLCYFEQSILFRTMAGNLPELATMWLLMKQLLPALSIFLVWREDYLNFY